MSYTTHAVEGFHLQIRKVTTTKVYLPRIVHYVN